MGTGDSIRFIFSPTSYLRRRPQRAMVYKFQCSLEAQDCATLYLGAQGRLPDKFPFTSQSCVTPDWMVMLGDVDSPGLPASMAPKDMIIARQETPLSSPLPNHQFSLNQFSLTIHSSWSHTTLPEWPMRRVSITTSHYRRILGNSNSCCVIPTENQARLATKM